MEFTITYEDFYSEEPIELDKLSEKYVKVYSLGGQPKRKEFYLKGKMNLLGYYLESNETLEEVLTQNQGKVEIRIREFIGEYLKTHYFYYDNGKPLDYDECFSLHDKLGKEICFQSGNETTKYFYDNLGKILYIFLYRDGKLFNMNNFNPKHEDYTNADQQMFPLEELDRLEDFNWKEMVYYHNAEPIIPE